MEKVYHLACSVAALSVAALASLTTYILWLGLVEYQSQAQFFENMLRGLPK